MKLLKERNMKRFLIGVIFFASTAFGMKSDVKIEPLVTKPKETVHPAALPPANGDCYFSLLPGDVKRKIMFELCQSGDSFEQTCKAIYHYQVVNKECLNLLTNTTDTNRDDILRTMAIWLAYKWRGNKFDDVLRVWKQMYKTSDPDAPPMQPLLLIYQSLDRIQEAYQALERSFKNPECPDDYKTVKQCFEKGFPFSHLIQTILNTDHVPTQLIALAFLRGASISDQCVALEKKYLEFRRAILDLDNDRVEMFIQSGIDVARPILGWTPLMVASSVQAGTIMRALIAAGASVNQTGIHGDTPLFIATDSAFAQIVADLIRAGARVNHRNMFGETALIRAAQFDTEEDDGPPSDDEDNEEDGEEYDQTIALKAAVQELLTAGADVNIQDPTRGLTALIIATMNGNHQMVQQLLGGQADPSIANKAGDTALSIATQAKDHYLIEELKQAEKKIRAQVESTLTTRKNCHKIKAIYYDDDEESDSESESEEIPDTDSAISNESDESETSVRGTDDEYEDADGPYNENDSEEEDDGDDERSVALESDDETESYESTDSDDDYRPIKKRRR